MLRNSLILLLGLVVIFVIFTGCQKDNETILDKAQAQVTESQQNTDKSIPENANTEEISDDTSPIEESVPAEDTDKPEGDGGGNEYNNDSEAKIIKYEILVNKDTYIYDNGVIVLKDFIDIITDGEDEILVIVTEDNATQNAYSELIDELKELNIPFEEK